MLDIAYALDQLLPAALYNGSLTANTESAYNAITWNDGRTKPTWSAIIAVPQYVPPDYNPERSQFDRIVEQLGTDNAESETGLNIQDNGFVASAEAVDIDTQFLHARQGILYWEQYTFRNENGEFFYPAWSEGSQLDCMVISTGGRVGINKPTNWLDYHALFIGTGLDDLEVGGVFDKTVSILYEISITSSATSPDQFKWRSSYDGGNTWGSLSAAIDCAITPVTIENGVTVAFGAIDGHTLADKWTFLGTAQLPDSAMAIYPAPFNEVLKTADYTSGSPTYTDVTNAANSTLGSIVQPFSASVTGALYIGALSKFDSVQWNITVAGVNITMLAEYWNGAAWTTLSTSTHKFRDGTVTGGTNTSLAKSGQTHWEKSLMTGWAKRYPPNHEEEGYELYWIRFRTTTAPSTPAQLLNVGRCGDARLAVYAANRDYSPVFYVDSTGKVNLQNVSTAKAASFTAAPKGYCTTFSYNKRPYQVNEDGLIFAPGSYKNCFAVKTNSQTNNSTTGFVDASGLTFEVAANTTYYYRFDIIYQSTSVSTGIGFGVNGPTIGAGKVLHRMDIARDFTVGSNDMSFSSGYDTGDVTTSVKTANTDFHALVYGIFVSGVTAGTFALRVKSETTNQVSVMAGSAGTLWEMN